MKTSKIKEPLGAIPTPKSIVKIMVDLSYEFITHFLQESTTSNSMYVLDNSVGDGRFLFGIVEKWNTITEINRRGCKLVLHGLDINKDSITKCKTDRNNFSDIKGIEISFKTGNALIGYVKPVKINEKEIVDENLTESYFNKIDQSLQNLNLKKSVFHWFYEWSKPNSKDGYHICIGNPPFGIKFSSEEKNIFKRMYQGVDPEVESYLLFVERSISLLREGGLIIFLIPNNFTTNYRYEEFRKFLLQNLSIKRIIMLGSNVFPTVSVETCILIGYKEPHAKKSSTNFIEFSNYSLEKGFSSIQISDQNFILNQEFKYIVPDMSTEISGILKTIEENSIPLADIASISRGIELGFQSELTSDEPTSTQSVPLIAGRNIEKFLIKGKYRYIDYDSNQKSIFKNKSLYKQPKILLRRIGHELIAALDPNELFCVCDVYIITLKPQWSHVPLKHLEIILNSPLLTFYLNHKFKTVKKIFPKIPISYLKQLPIKLPFSPKEESLIQNIRKELKFLEKESFNSLNELIFRVYRITKSQKTIVESAQ